MRPRLGVRLLAAWLSLAGACGFKDWRPLNPRTLRESAPQSIVLAISRPPTFYAGTYTSFLLFGPLGGTIAAAAAGDRIVRDNAIVDPAPRLGGRLVAALGRTYGLKVDRPFWAEREGQPDRPNADLILDCQTEGWGLDAVATQRALSYRVSIELLDRRKGWTLASGDCYLPRLSEKEAPSYEQALENGAAFLKAELDRAADFCVDKLARELLRTTLFEVGNNEPAERAFGRASADASEIAERHALEARRGQR
jgi:hypothetical protein